MANFHVRQVQIQFLAQNFVSTKMIKKAIFFQKILAFQHTLVGSWVTSFLCCVRLEISNSFSFFQGLLKLSKLFSHLPKKTLIGCLIETWRGGWMCLPFNYTNFWKVYDSTCILKQLYIKKSWLALRNVDSEQTFSNINKLFFMLIYITFDYLVVGDCCRISWIILHRFWIFKFFQSLYAVVFDKDIISD